MKPKKISVTWAIVVAAIFIFSCVAVSQYAQTVFTTPHLSMTMDRSGVAHVSYSEFMNKGDAFIIEQFVLKNQCGKLVLHMNNPGGDIWVMFDLIDTVIHLKDSGVHITTIGRGFVASASVPVFVLGDVRILYPHALLMMHPHSYKGYEAGLDESRRAMLDLIEERYIQIMITHTNMTHDEMYTILNTGTASTGHTYFTAEEALRRGIATAIK